MQLKPNPIRSVGLWNVKYEPKYHIMDDTWVAKDSDEGIGGIAAQWEPH